MGELYRTFAARQPVSCLALTVVLSCLVGGCSSLPRSLGGMPEGMPERPATPPIYPAVHDMPPARNGVPLNEADKKKLKDELATTRNRAARRAGRPDPAAATDTRSAGANRNP
jgi:hypothetical protein